MVNYTHLGLAVAAATFLATPAQAHEQKHDELGRLVRIVCQDDVKGVQYFTSVVTYAGDSRVPVGVDSDNLSDRRKEQLRFDAEGNTVVTVEWLSSPQSRQTYVCGRGASYCSTTRGQRENLGTVKQLASRAFEALRSVQQYEQDRTKHRGRF